MATSRTSRNATLFLQRSTANCRFLCASVNGQTIRVIALGELPGDASFEDVRRELDRQKTRVKQVVLLLPRSELDFNFLELPDVENGEHAQLIQNLVLANAETSGHDQIVTDFIVSRHPDSAEVHALAWSLSALHLKSLKAEAQACGFQLNAVTFEGFGAVALWRNQLSRLPVDATIFSVTSSAIDFAVIRNSSISQMRSIPYQSESEQSASEQNQSVSERLIDEYRRTLTVMGIDHEANDDVPLRVYLFGATGQKTEIAADLADKINVTVSVLNPLEKTRFADSTTVPSDLDDFVPLLGIASGWGTGQLEIDLCHPRRPVVNHLPWRRIAFWSALAILLLGSIGYVITDSISQVKAELQDKQQEFLPLLKEARRAQELGDELAAIRDWRKDEVVWLDQLDQLTDKLPPRDFSLIRRIGMSSTRDGIATINLAVEVNQADLVLQMENAFRSAGKQVTSKRVSESSVGENERWSFEPMCVFQSYRRN